MMMTDREKRMRNITMFLALGMILTGLPAGWAQEDPPQGVTVPDAALRAVLEDSLGLSSGDPITASELATLTTLVAPDAGIVDLTGLESATGLTRLHLGPGTLVDAWANSNDVSNLSPLSGLTGLTWLNLAGNSVVDVSPLSGLTTLTYLNLQVNAISIVSSLSSLTGLTDLYVAFNPVADASSLSSLTGLTVHDMPRPNRYPKLGSTLNSLVEASGGSGAQGTSGSSGQGSPGVAASVRVRIQTSTRDSVDTVARFLEDRGIPPDTWKGDGTSIIQGLLWARVPVSLLVRLSELPGVLSVRQVFGARSDQGGSQGISSSQIAVHHGASTWHTAEILGHSVRVGIIDQNFGGLVGSAGSFSSDDKMRESVKGVFCGGQDFRISPLSPRSEDFSACGFGATNLGHGTQVTSALLDIAPNVHLYLAKVSNENTSTVRDAVDWMLSDTVDVQVINRSASHPWDGSGDGVSRDMNSPLRFVETAVDGGVVWVNSAGNDAEVTWFSRSGFPDRFPLQTGGNNVLEFQDNNECAHFNLVSTHQYLFQLRWHDLWPGATRNLDLHLYKVSSNGDMEIRGDQGRDVQDGGVDHIPTGESKARRGGSVGAIWQPLLGDPLCSAQGWAPELSGVGPGTGIQGPRHSAVPHP